MTDVQKTQAPRALTLDRAWMSTCDNIIGRGRRIAPRDRPVIEIDHHTVEVDMRYPVLTVPDRALGYRFMAAEALWILSGSDRLDGIAPWSKRMIEFSDDGFSLAGAYGPRVTSQIAWVISKLVDDRDTRQAVMTLWTPRPVPSKDIPCTVAIDFKIRNDCLNLHVFMRSSDAWLGLPYDVFSFTMIAAAAARAYNDRPGTRIIELGTLFLTAASSHMYIDDVGKFQAIRAVDTSRRPPPPPMPDKFWDDATTHLINLATIRDHAPDAPARWWRMES